MNGDRAPTVANKITMSQLLFMAGVQERVAIRQNLEPSWKGESTEELYPVGSKVTPHTFTQLSRHFAKLRPDLPLRLRGAAGIPLPPPGGGAPGAAPVDPATRAEGPSRRDDLAYATAAAMTTDDVVRQVRDVMADVPQEYLSKAVQYLNKVLNPYSSVSRIAGQIAKFREPDQVAKFLDSFVWGTGLEQAEVKASLYASLRWMHGSPLTEVTKTVRVNCLSEILKIVLAVELTEKSNWSFKAIKVAAHLELEPDESDFPCHLVTSTDS